MSPSLRNLTPECVKSHMKIVKIPLSPSPGRLSLKPHRQLRARLRRLTADVKGLFETRRKTLQSLLPNENYIETHERKFDDSMDTSTNSDTSAYDDEKLVEASLVEIVAENLEKADNTQADAVVSADNSTHDSCLHVRDNNSAGGISCPDVDGLDIEYTGGCSLKACLVDAAVRVPLGLTSLPTGGSLDARSQDGTTDDSCDVVCPSSPICDDILAALDSFDVDADALSCGNSFAWGPLRDLQTIWEEDSTMFHSRCSVDAQRDEPDEWKGASREDIPDIPDLTPSKSRGELPCPAAAQTPSIFRVYQSLASDVAQAQPVRYCGVLTPHFYFTGPLQAQRLSFPVDDRGDNGYNDVD